MVMTLSRLGNAIIEAKKIGNSKQCREKPLISEQIVESSAFAKTTDPPKTSFNKDGLKDCLKHL